MNNIYIAKVTITVPNTAVVLVAANYASKKVIFTNSALFADCNSNTQVDDANDIDVVIAMYNVMEYSDNYLKTSGSLW